MRARIQRFVKPPGPYRQAQAEEISTGPTWSTAASPGPAWNDPG